MNKEEQAFSLDVRSKRILGTTGVCCCHDKRFRFTGIFWGV